MPKPYQNLVILTDFHDDIANAQIEMRFRNVFEYVLGQTTKRTTLPEHIKTAKMPKGLQPPMPAVMHVKDIPFGHIDYAAYASYASYRALGQSKPNIFIHVTDPGVGAGDDRSLLLTDWGNIFVGPNNGSLALVGAYLKERNITYTLHPLDIDKVLEFEQHRMETPTYHLPRTFHGRDVFAVVAGALAAGIDKKALIQDSSPALVSTSFVEQARPLPQQLGKRKNFLALRDNTYGNLKTNLVVDALTFDQMVEEGACFRIGYRDRCSILPFAKYRTFRSGRVFKDLPNNAPILYLGSTFAPEWDARFVELAMAMNSAADYLHLPQHYQGAQPLTIERIL